MVLPVAHRVTRYLVAAGGGLGAAPPAGGRVLGVPVQLDVSCLAAVALAAWTLADTALPQAAGGHPAAAYWLTGGLTALVLLASVAVHELAHGLTARCTGTGVRGVRLTLFGGATLVARQPATVRARITIALAGPLANLALATAAAVLHVVGVEIGADDLLVAAAAVVAVGNLGMAALNLLPAPPLDGGVVLHALLERLGWGRIDPTAATALAGRTLGGALIGLAVLASTSGDVVIGLWGGLFGLVVLENGGGVQAGLGDAATAPRTPAVRVHARSQRPAGTVAGAVNRRARSA